MGVLELYICANAEILALNYVVVPDVVVVFIVVFIVVVEHALNHFSDKHLPMFKLGTSTVHDGIRVPLILFCDLIKDGQLVDWQPF